MHTATAKSLHPRAHNIGFVSRALAVFGLAAAVGVATPGLCFAQAGAAPAPAKSAAPTVRSSLPLPLAAQESTARAVVANYAKLVSATYADTAKATLQLKSAVDALVSKPSSASHKAAKDAWTKARKVYGLTEAFRFYGGPIDDPKTGVEGLVNAWPMDEAYLDGVEGKADSGLVNNAKAYPQITRDVLLSANEKDGEKNISSGYHAVEFLLWGQDLDAKAAGKRSFKDFVDDGKNNAARRGQALKELTAVLAEHTKLLADAWKPGVEGNYAAGFVALPVSDSLQKILTGVATLSVDELAGERMIVPLDKRDQENEQSCFSDTTTNDIKANAQGIQNVWTGRYGSVKGPGLQALVSKLDAKLAATLTKQLKETVSLATSIPAPFDAVILSAKDSAGRTAAQKTIASLESQGQSFARAAMAAGLHINVQVEDAPPAKKE